MLSALHLVFWEHVNHALPYRGFKHTVRGRKEGVESLSISVSHEIRPIAEEEEEEEEEKGEEEFKSAKFSGREICVCVCLVKGLPV